MRRNGNRTEQNRTEQNGYIYSGLEKGSRMARLFCTAGVSSRSWTPFTSLIVSLNCSLISASQSLLDSTHFAS